MTAPLSSTDTSNLALDIIKTENVENIEFPEDDQVAVVMNRWWDVTRRTCLEGFPWVFAAKRAAILLDATAPDFGYEDRYPLPNDFLSLNFIDDESLPLSEWDYTIEDGYILINNGGAESLNIGYTFDQTSVVKYSAAFQLYLAHQLAYFTVFKLSGNNPLTTRIQGLLKPAQTHAKAVNGLLNPPKIYRESHMHRARKRYSLGG